MNETLKALLAQAPWCPDLTALPFYNPDDELDFRLERLVYKCTIENGCDFFLVSASPVIGDEADDTEVLLDRWDHPDATDIKLYAHWNDYEGNMDPILLSHMIKYGGEPIVHDPEFEPALRGDVF